MLTPQALAAALGLPPPTDEQAAVIAAPARSALVVAGAGAGKTETMAARVVWLVATGQVLPEQVLGLTFTRKAAQQLGVRVRTRLRRLAGSRLLDELDPTGARRAAVLAGEPTVATYHAYAGRLVGEHALRLPAEPGARLLGRPASGSSRTGWSRTWADDLDVDRVPATVTGYAARAGRRAGRAPRRAGTRSAPTPSALAELLDRAPPGPRQRAEPSQTLPAVDRRAAAAARAAAAGGGVRRAQAGRARARLRRPARDRRPGRRGAPRGREPASAATYRRGAARRVPGHRPRPAGAAAGAVRRGAGCARRARRSGGHRGRRPLPVDLRLARGERGQPRRGSAPTSPVRTARPPTSTACSPASATRREVLALANAVSAPLRAAPGAVGVGELRSRPGHRRGRRAGRAAAGRGDRARLDGRRRRGAVAGAADAGDDPPTSAVLVRRRADMDADRRGAAGPRAAGGGRRAGRAARHARGARPGQRAAPGGRSARRTGRGAAAHGSAVAAGRGRPGRAVGACAGAGAGGRRVVLRRRPPPSWRWARCPASTPSRPAWSTPSTTRVSPAATRRPASPGSGGSRRSCAGCGRARRRR